MTTETIIARTLRQARERKIRLSLPARRNDPVSSKLSALKIQMSGERMTQLAQAVELVEQYPGKTSNELAGADRDLRYLLARRLPEAEVLGLVKRDRDELGVEILRTDQRSGHKAVTWWPVDQHSSVHHEEGVPF